MNAPEELHLRFTRGVTANVWDTEMGRYCLVTFEKPHEYINAWDEGRFKWMGRFGAPPPPETERPEHLPNREEVAQLLTE